MLTINKIISFISKKIEKEKHLAIQDKIQNKCIIGKDSFIQSPDLLVNHDGDKNSIEIGSTTHVLGQIMTFPGGKIKIGDFCYLSINSRVWSNTSISIGNRVLISHDVNIFDNQTHPLDPVERHRQFIHIIEKGFPKNIDLGGRSVLIEDDVWIGCSSIILRGVRIGRGAVIGAGSVVTKDVPTLTLVAGNPARIIRDISEDCIRSNLNLAMNELGG